MEEVGGGDGAGDGAEVVGGFAEVLRDEVGGKVGWEKIGYTVECVGGEAEGFVVTEVGDDDVGGGVATLFGECGQMCRQSVDAGAVGCGNADSRDGVEIDG